MQSGDDDGSSHSVQLVLTEDAVLSISNIVGNNKQDKTTCKVINDPTGHVHAAMRDGALCSCNATLRYVLVLVFVLSGICDYNPLVRVLRHGQSATTDHPASALCIPLFHDQDEGLLCAMLLAATSKQPAHAIFEAWNQWGPSQLSSLGAIVITTEHPAPADTLLVTCNALLLGAAIGGTFLPKAVERIVAAANGAGIRGTYVPGRGMVVQRLLSACVGPVQSSIDVPTYCSPRSSITSDGYDEPPEDPALPSCSVSDHHKVSVHTKGVRVVQDVSTLVYADPALEALYMQQSVGSAAHVCHGIVLVCFLLATAWGLRSGFAAAVGMVLAATSMLAATVATMLGRWCVSWCGPTPCTQGAITHPGIFVNTASWRRCACFTLCVPLFSPAQRCQKPLRSLRTQALLLRFG